MIEITNKHILRKKILDVCVNKQQSLIDDLKSRIKSILDTQGLGNEEEYDNNEVSQKGPASEEVTGINNALSLANEEMSFLQHLKVTNSNLHHIVGPGAIAITNRSDFFVSVSIEEFGVDGKTFFGISTKSPLYLTMKGLPKGSIFQHNGTNYKILDIF